MKPPVRLFAPRVPRPLLVRITGLSLAGALVAGAYGIAHDQYTYSLAPEYFTKLKFLQFAWADFGQTPRQMVAWIGFLATWWVGFAATWFFTRLAGTRHDPSRLWSLVWRMWLVLFVSAGVGGVLGYHVGPAYYLDAPDWREAFAVMGLEDPEAFARVAGIHLGGYLGVLSGWLWAMFRVVRAGGTRPEAEVPPSA